MIPKVGDRVRIIDHSEAHGDIGVVWSIESNGIVLVELPQGCLWPCSADEIEVCNWQTRIC